MTDYRVTAPYVNLKIKDPVSGKHVIRGFYDMAVVAGQVEEACLKRHLDRGWLEPIAVPVAEPVPAPRVPESDPDKVPDGAVDKVLAWVGTDRDRAVLALAAEQGSAKPRTTLVDQLKTLAEQA